MYCSKCGKEIQEGINYCPYCSAKVNGDIDNASSNLTKTEGNSSKNNKLVLSIIIGILSAVIIAMVVILVFLFKGVPNNKENVSETTVEVTTIAETEETTVEETTVEKTTKEETTEEKTTKKEKQTQAKSNGNVDSIVQIIRDNYYGIQNNLDDFAKSGEAGLYDRWNDKNGVMRKIVLQPSEYEFRTMTNEYYYDENGMFQFAFLYDSDGNEYRYYFYENKVYRFIDAQGNITDYEGGEDPFITEDIGTVYSNGEREKHF